MESAKLPDFFKPLLWSYDFSRIDPEKHRKVIIVNTINYGDLKEWRWISGHYGQGAIRKILETMPVSELRPRVRKLAALLFSVTSFNDAPRSAQRAK